jgi:hypothetical protein
MSSHFLFHSDASETVPFNARYAFPTQASRVIKSNVKIPPRTGTSMLGLNSSSKGRTIQITLPSQGYLNPLESYLRFDLSFNNTASIPGFRCTNSIHTMFRRLRISYGSLVIEDIQNYGTLVRMITNVAVENDYANNSGAILEGMGSDGQRALLHAPLAAATGMVVATGSSPSPYASYGQTGGNQTHTYCLNLAGGFLTQQKLIPLKWMANQLTIELEIEEPLAFCIAGTVATVSTNVVGSATTVAGYPNDTVPGGNLTDVSSGAATGMPLVTYDLNNVYFVSELLEFDSTYDAAFYQGMLQGGVPIKFASWHGHQHVLPNATSAVLTIQERARSVKSAFTVIRKRGDQTATGLADPFWFYHGSSANAASGVVANYPLDGIDEFQWRIGGRYFPSQPVKCTNGGAEALIELQKALNVLGDYSIGTAVKFGNWYKSRSVFVIAGEFESTNGMEMSGINAEELADLALILRTNTTAFDTDQIAYTFIYYDAMIIIRPNNVVELVQ